MSVHMHVCEPVCQEATCLLPLWGGTQVFGLGDKDLYLLSHLTISISFSFF